MERYREISKGSGRHNNARAYDGNDVQGDGRNIR